MDIEQMNDAAEQAAPQSTENLAQPFINKLKKIAAEGLKVLNNFAQQSKEWLTKLTRQLKSFFVNCLEHCRTLSAPVKYSALAVLLIISLITAGSVYAYYDSFTYVVYLDGEEVGYVESETVIPEFAAALQQQQSEAAGVELVTEQELKVVREQRKGVTEDEEAVKNKLREQLKFGVHAYMLTINDKPVMPLASIADYQQVIDQLKDTYVPEQKNAVVQTVVLNDKLEAKLTLVDPSEICSVDKALEVLCYGTNQRKTYLVSRGDSLWSIAVKNNLSVTDIRNANPQLAESDKLMPGDCLNLVVVEPLVCVQVTQEVVETEAIPFTTTTKEDSSMYKGTSKVLQDGKEGKKEVTYRVTLENGKQVKKEALKEKVLAEPVEKIVAKGTKAVPKPAAVGGGGSGTGRFLWPVAGRGTITSRYGYRWGRFHRGLDIGTPTGTAILAADSGRVIQSGWSGAYGILVTIDHGNGFVTKYAHNSATLVTVGQYVQKGQQIARSGSTGNSTGPHLHFEIIKNGSNVNPLSYL
jgi:murein DD-endopeptidase MepM/ murein hydrolase activator NlpD